MRAHLNIFFLLKVINIFICSCESVTSRSIEELFVQYENDKNSMIAVPGQVESTEDEYDEAYEEFDNWMQVTDSMNIIFFGPSLSFLRLDAESVLHLLVNTKKHLIPISKALLAWDIVTDGKTAAFLQGREFFAFGSLLNVVPEEDLYYVNFGAPSVLKYFSKYPTNLYARKIGVLVSSYKRYFGDEWYKNGSYVNDLGFLLCGFPPTDFEKITPQVFTEISTDTLNKLDKCSANHTSVLFDISTQREAYGRPYKWSSHEITKLGMLLTYIPEVDVPSIRLEAVQAITPEVMKEFNQNKLEYFTKQQIYRMNPKTRRMYILRMQLMNSLTMNQLVKTYSKHK